MLTRLASTIVLVLPVFAAAAVIQPYSQCNTGALQCCNSVESASNPSALATGLLSLLNVVVGDITGQVGLTCSPITGIGAGGNSCTQQPVCCNNNTFNGVVAIGCTPINVSL